MNDMLTAGTIVLVSIFYWILTATDRSGATEGWWLYVGAIAILLVLNRIEESHNADS